MQISTLEGIVCQPAEFANQQPARKQEVVNASLPDPSAAAQLGRQDGFQVTYSSFPGTRNSTAISASTDCLVELYTTTDNAAQAVQAQQLFPQNVNVSEAAASGPGTTARSFEGTFTDGRGQVLPYTLIKWQEGRFVGSVTIIGASSDLARPAALTLAAAMDGRMLRALPRQAAQPAAGH